MRRRFRYSSWQVSKLSLTRRVTAVSRSTGPVTSALLHNVPIRHSQLRPPKRLPINLRIRIDEVVQRIAMLPRCEHHITTLGELDAILIVMTEEILALIGILGRLRCIDWNPAHALRIELGPAMVACDPSLPPVGGQREADREPRRNPHRTSIADEDGMEIGAVAPPLRAGVVDVPATPPLPALVVLHRRDHVIVDSPRHLEIGVRMRRLHHFARPFADLIIERNQAIGLEPLRQLLRVFILDQPSAAIEPRLLMLLSRRI